MFNFLLGLFVGANTGLFLYACILCGKRADKFLNKGVKSE